MSIPQLAASSVVIQTMESSEQVPQIAVARAVYAFANPFWRDHDLTAAWPFVDPLFRECWTQLWLHPMRETAIREGYDPDEIVQAFKADSPRHPLWDAFTTTQEKMTYSDPVHEWAATTNPRVVGLDLELVGLTPDLTPIPAGGTRRVMPFLMRLSDGVWRVLNFHSDQVPVAGWPPTI